ncbi:MAG: tetratricopeptide repeat protein [Acidobacteria bacterium]|nr:tetratricopeptide repeat protein [Acidobacteriota bacterium]
MLAVALFAVAMTVRLVHVWAIRDTPLFDVLMGDARSYDAWAQRIAGGDWVGTDVFYQAPLYPYFLGALYALAGRDLLVVRIVQAAIGSGAAVLLADAGTHLFSRRVGLLAGFGLALYAPAIFFDGLLQKSVLDVFFICLSIWCASRLVDRPRATAWWLGLGLSLGALSLTRENALALVFVAVVWAVSKRNHEGHEGDHEEHEEQREGRQESAASGSGNRRRPRARFNRDGSQNPSGRRGLRGPLRALRGFSSLGALVLGLTLLLLPVLVRNYSVTGGVYLTTSQFGPNFYIGNNPGADGTYASLRPGRGAPEYERQDATELAERALQRTLTPAEVSSYWTDRALAFIAERPGDWLALMARKVALLWNAGEMLDTESQETYEDHSPLLRALAMAGHFGVLVPLAIVGLVAAWPDRRRLWPFGLMCASYAASVVMFYVFARYRFPLVPFLLLLAAAGVASARALFASASPPWRVILGGAVALAAVAVNWPMLSPARMRAITETNLGSTFHEAGRYDEAVRHYERAVALEPDYAPAYNNLGVTLRAQGRVDAAIAAYEKGLALEDDYPDLHYNLANALLELGRADEAAAHLRQSLAGEPASAATHNNLGMAMAAKGQYAQAAAEFRAAIALDPGSALAHRNLGNALASMGRTSEALGALERAVSIDPEDAQAAYDLGSLLLEAGRFPEAAVRFEAALALDPRSVETLNNLGIALASQGRIPEAAALFERALAIQPDFADAQRNLATAREVMKR